MPFDVLMYLQLGQLTKEGVLQLLMRAASTWKHSHRYSCRFSVNK